MAVRFRNEHTSWAVSSPILWKIEIFDADHVGAVTDFKVEDGATIDYRADGDDVLAPMLSSNLGFTMVVEDATHEALITDLAGAEEGRFTVALYKDGVFNWAGVINSPSINFDDAYYTYGFKITAVDGLALLKNYPCSDNISSSDKWTDVYSGQSKLLTVISRCLKKLPHVVAHFTGSSKFIVSAINWYSDLHDTPVTNVYDPLFYTYIDNRAFAEGQSSGAAKFISCYDAIANILTCFNARIALYDGYFLIEQVEHRAAAIGAPANYSRYYDYALTAPTANTLTADQDIGGSNAIQKLRGGSYSFLPALRKVRAKQRISALQNLIPAFSTPSAGYLAGTVKGDGMNTVIRFTATVDFTLLNDAIVSTETMAGLFLLRIQLGSDTLLRTITWNGAGIFTYSTVTWDADTGSRIEIAVPIDRPAIGESETVSFPIDFMFLTNIGFTSGDLTVDFDFDYLQYLGSIGVVSTSDYTETWALRDAYCVIHNSVTPFNPKSVTYNVSGNTDNTQELSLETIIGDKDGDIFNQWGGLLFFDTPDYNYTSTWGNRDGTRDRPIIQLLAQRVMQMQYYPRKVLSGTAVGSTLVIQVPITESSETYILKSGVYSTHKDELAGEWVKLAFASESLTYAPAEYDTGSYEANTPNGGSGGGGTAPDTGGGGVVGTTPVGMPNVVQGDILYGSATNVLSALGKSVTATRYLSNTGGSNNPAWAQVDLSNGVTGSLPFANIGTIATQKLLGRYSAGTGVIEQITISTGLALDGSGNLTASGSGGTVTSVGVSGGTTGMTFSSSPITTSGTMTMSGTLVAANGGTGQSTYTVGDILYASAATTLTKLSAGTAGTFLRSAGAASPVAWSGTIWPNSAITGDILYASAANTYSALAGAATGNALISGGVSTAPSWGKIGLTTHISGTLDETNGGTGQSTVTQGDLLYGSAADTWSKLAKDATATRYLSNTGSSNNPAWAQVNASNGVTGTLPVANGGTGAATFTNNRVLTGNGTSAIVDEPNLTFDGTTLGLTGRITQTTTGSYSGTTYVNSHQGTITHTANNASTSHFFSSATLTNDGTLTGNALTGFESWVRVLDATAKASNLNGASFLVSSNSGNVTAMTGFVVNMTEAYNSGSLSGRIGVRSNVYFSGTNTYHAATGAYLDVRNTSSGRFATATGVSCNVSNSQTIYGNDITVISNVSTSNSQIGIRIFNNVSGSGVTCDNAYGIQLRGTTTTATLSNYYGVYHLAAPTATSTWFLYGSVSAANNYLAGAMGIGTSTVSAAKITVRGTGATSATTTAIFENSSGTDILYVRDDGNVGIGNSAPAQTLHVTGTARITGSDGTATALMGRDADGDVSAMAVSADLAITAGTLGLVDSTVITPSQITSNQNNYNPAGLSTAGTMLIYADNGFRQITGITAPSTAKKLTVANIGSYSILFPRENTGSSAANRIRMSRDFVLLPGKTAVFLYDTSATKWRILSVGDSYLDLAHLWFDTQITAPTTSLGADPHWQYSSDGSDWIIAPTAGRWSGHDLDTGATATGIGTLRTNSAIFESSTTAGQGVWGYFKAHIKTPSAVSDGTNTYLVKVGFVDAVSGGAVNGIYFSYDVGTSASWYAITRASATTTSTNTGTAFGADTVHLLELVYRPNGTAEFWLNGTTVATHSTNVPLTDLYAQIIIQKTVGTTERRLTWYAAQTTLARAS